MTPVTPATPAPRGVPRVPSWAVPRPRPLGLLDPDASLVVLHGPAGAGKTLLLASWVRAGVPAERTVVWLDAEAAGPEPWSALLEQVAGAGLLDDGPADAARGAVRRGGRAVAAEVVRALRAMSGPVLLVLDGYEAISSPRVDDDLVEVLAGTDLLHVAVTTRSTQDRLLAAAALRLDVVALGPDDLRLDDAEVADVLARAGQDPAAAHRVREAGDGLGVLVRTVALAAAAGTVDLRTASHRDLVDVAARGVRAVLERDPGDEAVLAAARRVSVAATLTPALADALAGDGGAALLARLERDGLGAWEEAAAVPGGAPAAGGPELRLTPVVRAALRADLERAEPEAVDRLLRTVVDWGLGAGRYYPALHAAAETGDVDLVTTVVMRVWGAGQRTSAEDTIRVLERLPRTAVAARPALALLLALLHNTRAEHRARALEWLAVAAGGAVLHLPRATTAERAVLRSAESVAMRLLGRGGRARTAALAAVEHLAATPPGSDATVDGLRALLHRQLGTSLLTAGDVERGLAVAAGGLAHERTGSLGAFTAQALAAGFLAVQGDVAGARAAVGAAAATEPPRRPETAYRRSPLDLARVHLALEDGDPAAAAALLDGLADELRTNEFWPAFAEARATADLLLGQAVAGEEALASALHRGRRAPTTGYWRARLAASRALLALAAGQPERGLQLLEPVRGPHAAARVARGRLLLSVGRRDEARALLAAPDLPDEGPRLRAARQFLLAAATAPVPTAPVGGASGADARARAEAHRAVASRALREGCAVVAAGGSRTGWLLVSPAERAAIAALGAPDAATADVLAGLAGLPAPVPDGAPGAGLTERELVVLRQLADDAGLAEVAARLHVSHNTVKSQARTAYRKLGVRNRADAVARLRELGLL
ncbi:LuxR C-terminal-related transcriptional regulator [Cellulomonas sp. Y8]|uniref:helix-turn-helix transcriptional regulator n=1 Tax=Cellulomonas sp. Y8 TaxID=2591145 RepID=UPI0011C74C77|nr:LuxR C-terminal-related transcriptional regulator [Cellulomonas sp. Y8]